MRSHREPLLKLTTVPPKSEPETETAPAENTNPLVKSEALTPPTLSEDTTRLKRPVHPARERLSHPFCGEAASSKCLQPVYGPQSDFARNHGAMDQIITLCSGVFYAMQSNRRAQTAWKFRGEMLRHAVSGRSWRGGLVV